MLKKEIDKPYFYKIINKINGNFYYGSGNFDNYVGSGLNLKSAYLKYGIENFEFLILKYFETRDEAYKFEDRFLKLHKISKMRNSYNIKDSSLGGDTISNNPNREAISNNMKLKMSGDQNSMYGISLKSLWISKYGEYEAEIKYEKWLNNVKMNSIKGKKLGSIENRILLKYGEELGNLKIKEYREKSSNSRKGENNHRFIKVEESVVKSILSEYPNLSLAKLSIKYNLGIKVIKRLIKTNK